MQNRITRVKCSVDGELPPKRKVRLAMWNLHPLHKMRKRLIIVKGY